MQRKTLYTVIIVLAVIALFVWIPKIIPKKMVEKEGVQEINVPALTGQSSYMDAIGQQNTELKTVFTSEGWYKGKHFSDEYRENNTILMKITNKLKPDDGIIDGFVLETLENGVPTMYVFLDDDWQQQIPQTKLYWGKNFQNEQNFDFSSSQNGVYMNKVQDDPTRFENNYALHYGGMYVGELQEDGTSTVIKFN